MFFLFFSYFGPEARNPHSSRRAGSQSLDEITLPRDVGHVTLHACLATNAPVIRNRNCTDAREGTLYLLRLY